MDAAAIAERERIKRILLSTLVHAENPYYFEGTWITGTALADRVAQIVVEEAA